MNKLTHILCGLSRGLCVRLALLLLTMICLVLSGPINASAALLGSRLSREHVTTTAAPSVYTFGVVGSLGSVSKLEHSEPTLVSGISGDVVQVAASNSDGYALTSSGKVFAWGAGSTGELGNGSIRRYSTQAVEVKFPAGVRITQLANPMPFDGALAIDSTGHAWVWGFDNYDDLCLPGAILTRPVRLALTDVTLATGARTHSLLSAHGTVYACGDDQDGVLGNGSDREDDLTPTPVTGLPAGVAPVTLTSSWKNSGALLSDGSYYDWGYNADGQLGNGTTTDSDVPVQVALPYSVEQVFQGGSGSGNGQTIAILSDGSVWTWGDGSQGQLGDDSTANSPTPFQLAVPAGVSFVSVASGGYSSYAIDTQGRLWDWGGNTKGQLGIGSNPTVVTTPQDTGFQFSQIAATAYNVVALGQD